MKSIDKIIFNFTRDKKINTTETLKQTRHKKKHKNMHKIPDIKQYGC